MPQPAPAAILLLSDHGQQREVLLGETPITIGRQPDNDLVLNYSYVSRHHARILFEEEGWVLIDEESRCGSFVNGRPVQRHQLSAEDVMHFGSLHGPQLRFRVPGTSVALPLRTLIGNMQHQGSNEFSLAKLSWFVEAARRLNTVGAMHEILATLIDTTLVLTGAERGFVFLRAADEKLVLAAGRNKQNEPLSDDVTLSHSAINHAIESGREFIVTDTLSAEAAAPSESMVAQNLRSILCIPLRKHSAQPRTDTAPQNEILGLLYLDSRQHRSHLMSIDNDLLHMIAGEAAMLVENTRLAEAEQEGRRYREELRIASEIQQGLMQVRIPELSYARVNARSLPCKGIGGDFYDAIAVQGALYLVVADVSGKGISAALLGATLQGLIYAQVLAGQPLAQIATFANSYICNKDIGKYATLVLLRLSSEGEVEYINCGHVQPLLHTVQGVAPLPNNNFPVGLFADAAFESGSFTMQKGERALIVTDGVTEAETAEGDYYGEERLRDLFLTGAEIPAVLAQVEHFTGGAQREDDCTIVEICFASCQA